MKQPSSRLKSCLRAVLALLAFALLLSHVKVWSSVEQSHPWFVIFSTGGCWRSLAQAKVLEGPGQWYVPTRVQVALLPTAAQHWLSSPRQTGPDDLLERVCQAFILHHSFNNNFLFFYRVVPSDQRYSDDDLRIFSLLAYALGHLKKSEDQQGWVFYKTKQSDKL